MTWLISTLIIGISAAFATTFDDNLYLNAFFCDITVYNVAAVTVANGTDNISIYVPLFASRTWESLLVILGVFFVLVGVLCYVAYKLTRNKAIADVLPRYGNNFMPFVLIGLGAFIMVDSGTFTLLNLFDGEISPYE